MRRGKIMERKGRNEKLTPGLGDFVELES